MAAPLGDENAADRRAAAWTRFAGAPVDIEELLVFAGLAVCVAIVRKRGAAALDAGRQHLANRGGQTSDFHWRKSVGSPRWMKVGCPERFVCIQVADTRHKGLVQQE